MMKKLFFCLSIFLIFSNAKAQTVSEPQSATPSNGYIPSAPAKLQSPKQGTLSLVWKPVAERTDFFSNSTWVPSDSGSYYYDANANDTAIYDLFYSSGSWENNTVNYTRYDAQGHLIASGTEQWISYLNAWRNETQTTQTYNSKGDTIELQYQSWDTAAGKWQVSVSLLYNDDNNHNDTDEIERVWNAATNSFNNIYQWINAYNSKGSETSWVWQIWESGAWKDSTRGTLTYDSKNNITEMLDQIWNAVTGTWDNYDRYTYLYSPGEDTVTETHVLWDDTTSQWNTQWKTVNMYLPDGSSIRFDEAWDASTVSFDTAWEDVVVDSSGYPHTDEYSYWNGSLRIPQYESVYSYDSRGNNILEKSYSGDSTNKGWTVEDEIDQTYDANNNLTEYLVKPVYGSSGFTNYTRTFYYYKSFNSDVANATEHALSASIFPNPLVTNEATLNVNYSESSVVGIIVYDEQGSIVSATTSAVIPGNNNIELPIRNIAAGNYFVRVVDQQSGKTSVLKMTKE